MFQGDLYLGDGKDRGRVGCHSSLPPHEYPLDKWVPKALDEWRIKAILTPSQELPGGPKSKRELDVDTAAQVQQEIKRMRGRQQQQPQSQPKRNRHKKGKGQGKKGKQETNNPRMPKRLINMLEVVNGEKACYAFNLEACPQKGACCAKGVHACMVPGCGATDHGVLGHR